MVEELLLRARRELPLLKEKNTTTDITLKNSPPVRIMDHPVLSLGPSMFSFTDSSYYESEANSVRKRKLSSVEQTNNQPSIDLQLNKSLPFEWEQCLDLETGRMYCINRKTLRKSWVIQKDQKIDLDLNISSLQASEEKKPSSLTINVTKLPSGSDSGSGMVAIVCLNCYLLVMLYRSSPSCPNCKFMHSLLPSHVPRKLKPVKSPETLSLLQ